MVYYDPFERLRGRRKNYRQLPLGVRNPEKTGKDLGLPEDDYIVELDCQGVLYHVSTGRELGSVNWEE